MSSMAYDYIVIGAGSAGCVLASRLSEDPDVKVLLVEAGPPSSSIFVHMPAGIRFLYTSEKLNWQYWTEPQPRLENRKIYIPRGRVVGGSSSINSMIAIRCNKFDYDNWAAQGLPGWEHDRILPYLKKIENASLVSDGKDKNRGYSGPIKLSFGTEQGAIAKAFVESAVSAGLPHNPGFNGKSQVGAGFYELSIADGRRSGGFKYLEGTKDRSNLTLMTNSSVRRIAMEGNKATGVVVLQGGKEIVIRANNEVLLCAGAIGSPQLLMLSGIGPAAHLQSVGIKTAVDLVGVGENLQDHLDVAIRMVATEPITLTPYLGLIRGGLAGAQYMLTRSGPGTSQGVEAGAFYGSSGDPEVPEWQAHFINVLRNPPDGQQYDHGFAVRMCQLRPKSRGTLKLRSSNPADYPIIDPRFLSEEADVKSMQEGVEHTCHLIDQPALRKYTKLKLDKDAFGDAATRKAWIHATAETIYHPVGTCRMGVDNEAVVDGDLKVRGASNLRVIDGSIMPAILSGNTNLPIMAMAEKMADIIRKRPALTL